MAEATQEMIALAREIAERHADSAQECLFGPKVSQTVRRVLEDALAQAALAAIQATTQRAAAYVRDWNGEPEPESDLDCLAYDLRSGDHLKEQSA